MGLSQVAQAVSFLNVDCKMVSPPPLVARRQNSADRVTCLRYTAMCAWRLLLSRTR